MGFPWKGRGGERESLRLKYTTDLIKVTDDRDWYIVVAIHLGYCMEGNLKARTSFLINIGISGGPQIEADIPLYNCN